MSSNIKTIIFLSIFIFVGLMALSFGINRAFKSIEKTKSYIPIKARFINSSVYSSDDDGTTYTLTYEYTVNGNKYTISTDYGSGSVPAIGSIKTIKYNPHNPSEAIITGFNSNTLLIMLGSGFIVIPVIVMIDLFKAKTDKGKKIKYKATGILLGLILAFLGCLTYYAMCSGGDSLSIIDAFKSAGLWIFIPILFVVVGIYIVITTIIRKDITYTSTDISQLNYEDIESNTLDIDSSFENQTDKVVTPNIGDKILLGISILISAFPIIGAIVFTGFCLWVFIAAGDLFTRIVIIPFLICGLAVLTITIAALVQNVKKLKKESNHNSNNSENEANNQEEESKNINFNKVINISSNIYIIAFLIFWFGFLIFFDYLAIKQLNNGGLTMILFSLIFWIAGIFMAYKNFKK